MTSLHIICSERCTERSNKSRELYYQSGTSIPVFSFKKWDLNTLHFCCIQKPGGCQTGKCWCAFLNKRCMFNSWGHDYIKLSGDDKWVSNLFQFSFTCMSWIEKCKSRIKPFWRIWIRFKEFWISCDCGYKALYMGRLSYIQLFDP